MAKARKELIQMKRSLSLALVVLMATFCVPSFASAGGHGGYHGGGYHGGHGGHGHSNSSFGFSFGFFTGGPTYASAYYGRPAYYRPYYRPAYYRPYYRP